MTMFANHLANIDIRNLDYHAIALTSDFGGLRLRKQRRNGIKNEIFHGVIEKQYFF